MKISIIIPVYNVEEYLDKCLETVVGQTYSNLEIILVNDGSTDNSGLKCDDWKNKDKRIKVFHKSNGGLMTAWKYGVERATGDYVGFVDSDDWIDTNMFETLLKMGVDNAAELVVCNFIHENNQPYKQETFLRNGVYTNENIKQEIYPIMIRKEWYSQRGLVPSRVVKLFKKKNLLDALPYCDENVSIGEDLLTTFSVMSNVSKLVVLGDFYPYHYRETNSSIIRSFSEDKYERVESLKRAMLKANSLYDYDFLEQIQGDYVSLILEQIDLEILYSKKKWKEIERSIAKRVTSNSFCESLKYIEKKKLSFKFRLYLFFIKCKLISGIIFLRKLKKN